MWKTITEVSGRKTFSRSKNKLSSQEERVELRKKQFEDLIAKLKKKIQNFVALFYELGWTVSRLQCHNEETVYFLLLYLQDFLVLIWSTSEGWKAKLTLDPTSGFDLESMNGDYQNISTKNIWWRNCTSLHRRIKH